MLDHGLDPRTRELGATAVSALKRVSSEARNLGEIEAIAILHGSSVYPFLRGEHGKMDY